MELKQWRNKKIENISFLQFNNKNRFHQRKQGSSFADAKINCVFSLSQGFSCKHIFEKYPFMLRSESNNKWDQERRRKISYIRKIFRLSSFAGAFFSLRFFCVVKELCEKICKTLGAASNYWQSTRSYCTIVDTRRKKEMLSIDIRQSTNIFTNHHAWICWW